MPERTAVYRLYDAADDLLYVGMSNQPEVRWRQHAVERRWWSEVARKDVAWFGDREAAAAEEMRAVVDESPRYNTIKPKLELPAITVRLPLDLYECLRREAFETRTSQADIIRAELADRYGRTVAEGVTPDGGAAASG